MKFHVFARLRRGEFAYGIVSDQGVERDAIADEEAAYHIVKIMNENCLDSERIAELESKSKESLRPHWLKVKREIENGEMRI